jgi:predicted DCC family thiol-disulfide oxidoreductase YuxK
MDIPVLVYDGHCNFCRRQASRLTGLSGGRLKLESFHDPGVLERYGLSRAACEEAMQLVLPDGRVFSGAAAAAQAFRLNPLLAWLSLFYAIPGLKQIADAVYRWVAKNRFRFGGRCTDGACAHH